MRFAALLTLGIAVFGPALIDASERRIVFVVPRYIRRSYDTTQFFEHREPPTYKARRSPRRPFTNSQNFNSEQFYLAEKHRAPQGGDDFNESIFTPHQQVRHVLIPHGKGISHGISFGKGYIPHKEFKETSEEYNFPVPEGNHLDFEDLQMGHRGSGQFRFEDNEYNSQFRQPGNDAEWLSFAHNQQEEPQHQGYRIRMPASSSSSNEEIFFPKYSQVQHQEREEEKRSLSGAAPAPHPVIQEHKPTPLVFQDTIDMKEYVEKVQAFARSWPHAAGIQTFGWQNQIPSPQIQSYNQGFNPWTAYLQPQNPGGGYQVQEESAEESNRRHFRHMLR